MRGGLSLIPRIGFKARRHGARGTGHGAGWGWDATAVAVALRPGLRTQRGWGTGTAVVMVRLGMRGGLSLILRTGFMARRPELDWHGGSTGMQPLSRSRYDPGTGLAVVVVRLWTRSLVRGDSGGLALPSLLAP